MAEYVNLPEPDALTVAARAVVAEIRASLPLIALPERRRKLAAAAAGLEAALQGQDAAA